MNLYMAVIVDKSEAPEIVHEMADARAGGADHLRQDCLADLCGDRYRSKKICACGL